jgi:predicted TIM-barrel fold metal-dependent hydrolase
LFLGSLVFDGVFDRHPNLRGCVTELGATWVPSWLRQLDHAARAFKRAQPEIAALPVPPSQTVRERCKFTPFAGEDVGWLIEQEGADLWMFSSNYPHHEGTDDPIGRFEKTLGEIGNSEREAFYFRNFVELFGLS